MGTSRASAFGRRLRDLRKARGLTLQQLAARARRPDGQGLSHGYLSLVENGLKPPPRRHTLIALEKALEVRSGTLVEDATQGRMRTSVWEMKQADGSRTTFEFKRHSSPPDRTQLIELLKVAVRHGLQPVALELKLDARARLTDLDIIEEIH